MPTKQKSRFSRGRTAFLLGFNVILGFLIDVLCGFVTHARQKAYQSSNAILLQMYWQIGYLIVEDEQHGDTKAIYGKGVLRNLAEQLTLEFGKGFDERNLNNMRAFYNAFPIWNAVRTELSWTHYAGKAQFNAQPYAL